MFDEIKLRLANLKKLKAEEMKSDDKSKTYIADLNESIKDCERRIKDNLVGYEMVPNAT